MRVGLWSAGGRTDAFTRPAAFQDGSLWPTSYGPLYRIQNLAPTGVPTLPRQTIRTKLSSPASTFTTQNSLHVSATNNSSSESLSPDEEAAYQEFLQKRAAERKAWKQEMRRRANFDPMASPPSQSATSSRLPPSAAPLSPSAVSPPVPLPALTRPKPPLSPPQATNPTTPTKTASLKQTTNAVRNARNAGTTQLRPPSKPLNVEAPNARSISNSIDTPKKAEVLDDEEEDEDELDLDAMVAMARRIMQEPDNDDEGVAIEDGEEDMDRTARGPPATLQRPVRQTVRSAVNTSSSGTSSGRGDASASAGTGAATGGMAPSSQSPPPSRGTPGAPAPKRRLMPIAHLQRQRAAAAAAAAEVAAVEAARVPSTSGRQGSAGVAAAGGGTRRLRAATGGSRREPLQRRQEEQEDGEQDNEVADDLDWDALQAYEKYEQYLNEVAEEAPKRSPSAAASKRPQPLARRGPGGSLDVGSSSNSALTSTSASSAGAAADAATAKKTEGTPKVNPASAGVGVGASSSSSSGNKSSLARVDGNGRSKASLLMGEDEDEDDGNDPASRLDAQLDQWEQLIRLFEMAEKESKREEAKQQKSKAAAASDVVEEEEAEEANVDWQALEKLFLGDKWETELDELQTRVATGVAEAEAAMQASEAGESGEGADAEPWKDELSTLLVGLVDISARRYLGRNLLPPPSSPTSAGAAAGGAMAAEVNSTSSGSGHDAAPGAAAAPQQQAAQQLGEEERAEAYWQAPFLLLVQDDSADPVLEYVNAAALDALRLGSFQDATAGIPAATLVDERHAPSQSEWIWAASEATERPEGYAIISSLRLRGPGPDAPTILATDVAVFQVDSLQGEPIGQAVVAANWRVLAAGE